MMCTEAEISEALYRYTLEGWADRVWKIDCAIHRLRELRKPLEDRLLEYSAAHHNGKDEPWREGVVIQGKTSPPCYAKWEMTDSFPPKYRVKLKFDTRRTDANPTA